MNWEKYVNICTIRQDLLHHMVCLGYSTRKLQRDWVIYFDQQAKYLIRAVDQTDLFVKQHRPKKKKAAISN
jgi:hypothetical protein